MGNRLQGKVCVVTGGARGLGFATAQALLAEGARVMITDVDRVAGASAAAELGADASFSHRDVTQSRHWDELLDAVIEQWGALDVLVNNAGIVNINNVEKLSLDDWQRTLDVNLSGVFLGTQAAIARMKTRGGGSIVNIASIEGLVGAALLPSYNASKGGVRLFSRSAAIHCARSGYNIRINNVCPGVAETRMACGRAMAMTPEQEQTFIDRILPRIPMGRLGKPSEIAAAVLFLASDESSYVTGSDLIVDGGLTA